MSSIHSNINESDNTNEKGIDPEEDSGDFFDNDISTSYEFSSQIEGNSTYKNTIDLSTLSIDDLIDRRDRYIDDLKLEKAQEIDSIIDYLRSIAPAGPIQKVKDYLSSKFEEYYAQYQDNCNRAKEDSEDNEIEIRKAGDDLFVEMKSRHIEQLIEIEKMRAYELIFNRNKPVQEANAYERRAKYSAQQKEYDKAYHFRQQANQEREKIQNERRGLVEEKMNNLKTNVLSTMKSEMKILAGKIQSQIEENQTYLNEELDSHLRTFKVLASSETQKAIFGLNNYFPKKETKRLLAIEISNYASSKLKEITGMDVNISLSAQASPSKQRSSQSQTASASPYQSTNTAKQQSTQKQNKQSISPKQQKQLNTPKQQKQTNTPQQQKQTNTPQQQKQQEANQPKQINTTQKVKQEKEETPVTQEKEQNSNEDHSQQPQNNETNEPADKSIDPTADTNANIDTKEEEEANIEDINANANTNETNNDDVLKDAENNKTNDSIDDLILGNDNNINNDESLNLNSTENDNGIVNEASDKKSNTDAMLDNLLNGGDDDDFLAGLGEGNSNDKQNDLNTDSILDLGED